MTHQVNLLPWRKMKRDCAKKKLKIYGLVVVMTISVGVFFTHYYLTQLTHQPVLSHSIDQDVYLNQRKQFNEQFKKTTAKLGQQSLDSLHYIGLLKDGSKTWALISQSDGLVFSVMPGDYLGKEHGRVARIQKNRIDIEKRVWSKQRVETKWIVLHLRS